MADTVWILHDYGEGGDHSDVEGVYATREAAVQGFEKVVAKAREDNDRFEVGSTFTVEWDEPDSPVIYEEGPDWGSAWYFLIQEHSEQA